MSAHRVRYRFECGGDADPAPVTTTPAPPLPTRIARQLALAYHVERLIESGALKDYADAARRLGITRARMTQIANLRWLACGVQERILAGERVSERGLRGTSGTPRASD